jgi:hypothetical protein
MNLKKSLKMASLFQNTACLWLCYNDHTIDFRESTIFSPKIGKKSTINSYHNSDPRLT